MATTPRAVPYSGPTDPNNVPADIQALAQVVNDRPGISTFTTAERDALAGAQLWTGRIIYNLTTTQAEKWSGGTAWAPLFAPAWKTYTPVLSGTGWELGNGTLVGKYIDIGKERRWKITLTFGSTTVVGSGSASFSLPAGSEYGDRADPVSALFVDLGAKTYAGYATYTGGLANISAQGPEPGRFVPITATHPFTWTTGDVINASGFAELT